MSDKYTFNFSGLAKRILPISLRQSFLQELMLRIAAPLVFLKVDFDDFMDEKSYRLAHNGQVCYLRAALNDSFDKYQRRIYLSDMSSYSNALILHLRSEAQEETIETRDTSETFLYRRGYGGGNDANFTVNVPTALQSTIDEDMLKAVVNEYKLAGMQYTINYV